MVANDIGRTPRTKDIAADPRVCAPKTVIQYFGTYIDALRAAGYTPNRTLSRADLAREMNRLFHELDVIPSWKDVKQHSRYSKFVFQQRFATHDECLRQSNITPPIDHVRRALRNIYNRGHSYVTTRKLRQFMYPRLESSDKSRDFGVDSSIVTQTDEQAVKASWDYPQLSVARVGQEMANICDQDTDVSLELWSDSQRKTWRICITE